MKSLKKMLSLALSAIMLAAVIPTQALAAETTKAVKEDINWTDWQIPNALWATLMDSEPIYVQQSTGAGTALNSTAYLDDRMRIYIDDAGSTTNTSYVISEQSGYTSDGVNWGFMGTKYYTGWLGDQGARYAEFPTDRWLGVKDISAHKDTGYAIFTIESVTGDAANAYLAIKTAPEYWDVEELVYRVYNGALVNPEDTEPFPITPDRYPVRNTDQPFKEFYGTKVVGVSLTDYYDVSKGGQQTVAVPISEFVDSPDFKEVYIPEPDPTNEEAVAKYTAETFAAKRNLPLDLRLFGGMGIARKDSGKQQAFSAVITALAIVDPAKPEIYGEFDGEYVGVEVTRTTDEDVDYKLRRTCNGLTEEVEFTDIGEESLIYEGTIDPTKSYTFQAVAVDQTYGIEVASDMVFIGAEGVEIEKANMNWKDWVGTNMDPVTGDFWKNYLEGENYYVGTIPGYNNYNGFEYAVGGNFKVYIDDHDVGSKYSIAEEMYKVSGEPGSDPATIPNVGGFWGYQGMSYGNLWSYPDKTKVPDDIWFGIKSIKDWEKSGYAVFTVNEVTGDTANAYLAITTLTDQWQLPQWAWTMELPITKAGNEDKDWNFEHGMSVVAGVNLADYYDVEKGGVQTVAVPLDKLVNNPDFMEIRGKDYNSLNTLLTREDFEYVKANLHLFTGMGVARRDSGADETFAATISEMKIVGLQTPTNLVATKNLDGSLSFTFTPTSDVGVEFKIAKTVDGVTTYLDAPGGACTDSDIDPKKQYTYKAVAYDPELKIYSPGSEEYVEEADFVSVVRADFDWKNWTGDWCNYMEDETYYYGTLGVYNDYAGGHTYFNGGDMPVGIDDAGAATAKSIATQMYANNDGNGGELIDIPNIGGFWGYSGLNYNKMRTIADKSNVPADIWFGVKSIKADKDTGYAVFTLDNVTGDAENAYLAITTLPDPSQIPAFALDENVALPITKAGNESKAWNSVDEHYVSVVTGAKLTDYYDVAAGGEQTVKVPLSVLVDDPEFMEFRAKVSGGITSRIENEEYMASFVPELHLFTGMGIAKRDSGADKTFAATVKAAKIVAVEAPANFAAELNSDGSVTATFDTTMDKEVAFKVKRVCDGEAVYFDAPEGTYTDTTRDSAETYTYSAVAVYDELAIESESAETVTFEGEVVSYAKIYKGEGEGKTETKYVTEGTMSASFFTTEAAATGYIARYNAEGRLLGANLVAVPVNEEVSASLANVALTDTVKVMFWSNYEAVVDPIMVTAKTATNVLYIGDELAPGAATYIDDFAAADGQDYDVTTVYFNGATVQDHAANVLSGADSYNVAVNGEDVGKTTLKDILADDVWDYIVVQEDIDVAIESGAYAGFADLKAALASETDKVYVANGWVYGPSKVADQEEMYIALDGAAADLGVDIADTAFITASVYLELSMDIWGDDDDMKLNESGSYATGLKIYGAISGADVSKNTFAPAGVDTEAIKEYR